MKAVHKDAQILGRYLHGRHIPPEQNQLKFKRQQIADKLRNKMDISDDNKQKKFDDKVEKILKYQTYKWEPIMYDNYKSLQYLLGRSAQEYSTISRIFTEIENRDPTFKPKSYFDFGSGVGTGLWAAANHWKASIFEYFLVDSSRSMNDLADLILRDGEENKQMELRNVNFRQFFPASVEVSVIYNSTGCNFTSTNGFEFINLIFFRVCETISNAIHFNRQHTTSFFRPTVFLNYRTPKHGSKRS